MRFTKPSIAALVPPADKTDYIEWDDDLPGFGIRFQAGGKGRWIVQYRIGVQQRRKTLGSVAAMDVADARKEAKKALRDAGLGFDPQLEKERRKKDLALTFGSLIDGYLEVKEANLRPKSYHETERYLRQDWKSLHRLPISAIDRAAVANQLSVLSKANGPVAAARARAALSAFYTWAVKEGKVDMLHNPVLATNSPAAPASRDRALSFNEIVEVWNALEDDDFGRIVKLLLLTGQRREEIAALSWSEVDLDAALISLPGARTKNHLPHDVPLSDQALAMLKATCRRDERDLVFGRRDGPFSGFSKSKTQLDKRIHDRRIDENPEAKSMPHWTIHDIRRTAVTRMGDIGVQPHVVEAILNHISGTKAQVAGIYNRSVYAKEKREALGQWGEHVEALVSGGSAKVTHLRRAQSKDNPLPSLHHLLQEYTDESGASLNKK